MYCNTKLNMFAIGFVLLSTVIICVGIVSEAKTMFGLGVGAPVWMRVWAVFVLAFAVFLGAQRDVYLPFLGQTVMPTSLFADLKTPQGADQTVIINTPGLADGTKVVYWGASAEALTDSESEDDETPWTAYRDYTNSGISEVKGETVEFKFACPMSYKVKGRRLPKHIHFRSIDKRGMMSPVETVNVSCKK